MKTGFLLALIAVSIWCTVVGTQPPAGTHTVALNGHVFTLPVGFDIELVAGPPLVNRPITADFDEEGRLYVSDSSGSNDKVDVQLKTKPHRIVRLEDTTGTGKFDRATVFADKMMFPEGTMWFNGSLYVSAVPVIWKLTDTDGDGVADQRVVWFDGKTMTGCANDLHGPYRGPDGWIYWCKGAFAKQTYERPGKEPFSTRAAHVFRARPDGSGVEPVMTGGMDNPVDLVFTPGGERIFTTTFFQFPGGGRRDGLVHAVYGGIYGKDWDVIYDPAHKWTGPGVMPVLTHLGPAAPAGMHCYESSAFGKEYTGNLFAVCFNLQKVTRHVLVPHGATFKTHDSDFVVSNNKDFHPTDVIEDADGSLLIIDTGGWYKLCCPTSQLVKPDILGAIYRVRKSGAPPVEDPRGRKIQWAKLSADQHARLLDDRRPAVRRRAIDLLSRRGADAIPALATAQQSASPEARRNSVWCLTRMEGAAARQAVRRALSDTDESVRQAALHSIAVHRDAGASSAGLLEMLGSKSAHNRRAAAEALGRTGDANAVPVILAATAEPADRFLEHSLTYALIEIADAKKTEIGLTSPSPSTRRAALIALDGMAKSDLTAQTVLGHVNAKDAALQQAAWWIASRHPEWGTNLSVALRDRMAAKDLKPAERDQLVQQLAKLAKSAAIQQLLAHSLVDDAAPTQLRRLVLHAMGRAGLKEAPAAWLASLTHALASRDADVLADAVATVRSVQSASANKNVAKQTPAPLVAALLKLGEDANAAPATRLGALAAITNGLAKVDAPVFDFLRKRFNGDEPAINRALAAESLARARLTSDQLMLLADSTKSAGPMEINRLLEAFGQSQDPKVGSRLVESLGSSAALASLRPETLKPLLGKYGPPVLKSAEGLLASLEGDSAQQRAKLEAMLTKLPAGDVRRGQSVFNNPKVACVTCHQIGYLGGNVGPDLTRIGSTRTERDLLESIVFPSASFVRGYEPMMVVTKDGKVYTGVLRKDAPDEVVLVSGAAGVQEFRIPREEIDEMAPSRVSVMPAGLDQQLTLQELADLVAFLKASR
jgi:putative membrane-bound dehydrogenase-like protein